jgi:cytidine deaminase
MKKELIEAALAARKNAFAPYSHFFVGAALADESGKIFPGANVESSSYGLSICAERHAIGAAVVAGSRKFTQMVIASDRGVSPCGACRQVICDVCGDIELTMVDENGHIVRQSRSSELLPAAFGQNDLENK